MPILNTLDERQQKMLREWPCPENQDFPWSTMRKPLSESKVSMVTTGGLHVRGDDPFRTSAGADASFRTIPRKTPSDNIVQSHFSISFDRTSIYRDLNVTYPVDRLNELVNMGKIGTLSQNYYSFMGAIRDVSGLIETSGPLVAEKLKSENVDIVLLTPT